MSNSVSPKSFIQKYSISLPKKPNRKRSKISDKNFVIPKIGECELFLKNNHSVRQLKEICRFYKIKVGGNKDELLSRIYNNLRLASGTVPLQRLIRSYLVKKLVSLKGQASLRPTTWVNQTDFLTLATWDTIDPLQYFTYTSSAGQIYGFDIKSLAVYLNKNGTNATNPYTREKFPVDTVYRIKRVIQLAKALRLKINIKIETPRSIPLEQRIKQQTITLFQTMDQHNHYTNHEWFSNLSMPNLIKFIRELSDIWGYRAHLSNETKREICPPMGNPFHGLHMNQLSRMNILSLKETILGVLNKLINRGVTQDARALGVYYVLTALTLVSSDAANAYPWLYQSVQPTPPPPTAPGEVD
tara:strand:+ start:86 stop:1156 length:1071 start_codon:yes stop_codon:yes gene_type:complete